MNALKDALLTHLYLCGVSMAIAMTLGIALGIIIARVPILRQTVLSVAGVSQTIPSLALLALLIPILGIGKEPALVALVFYALYPIIKNTVLGLNSVPLESLEAADALGLKRGERLVLIELPLAMPSIIAGVRIATAMTIGIATIAALIGAGGLGDFITQGLALNDMSLVLLGALPAAILAILADLFISMVQKKYHRRSGSKVLKLVALGTVMATILFVIYDKAKSNYQTVNTITVASKNFSEQFILAEIMAQLIEAKTKLRVNLKHNLGTTDLVHQALINGDIDLIGEYTGTAFLTIMHRELALKKNILEEVRTFYDREFNLAWLKPFGFNNSQSIATSKTIANKYNLTTLSDLALVAPKLTIGAPAEFIKRPDAYIALNKTYGLQFKDIKQMDPSLMYTAIENLEVDLIVAFSTDGRLKKYNLISLIDDKNFAPSYEAAPVIRNETLMKHPRLKETIELLAGSIDNDIMTRLNQEVELNKQSPARVARDFLHSQGFLE